MEEGQAEPPVFGDSINIQQEKKKSMGKSNPDVE